MAETRRRTFRVRNIPSHIKGKDAARFMKDILVYEGTTEDISVYSLAPDVESYERPPTKVATVTFTKHPLVLSAERKEWSFSKERLHLGHDVIFDTHFLGFTVLNDVTAHKHVSDCIAISGLASHPFGSWKARGDDSDFMWLRDILPMRYPGLRCIIYGYDTHLLDSHSFKSIEDISRALTIALKQIGSGLPSSKPTIFMAHSLGGIVLKEALIQMAKGNDMEMYLSSQIKKIVFFGVPNRGMHISHLIPMVKGQPNEALVHRLSEQSTYLADLDERSSNVSYLRSTRVVSIYETRESQVPKLTASFRRSNRDVGTALAHIQDWSANNHPIHYRSEEQDTYPVDKDHSNLVKFSRGDHDLSVVLEYLNPDSHTTVRKTSPVSDFWPILDNESLGLVAQPPSHRVPDLFSDNLYQRDEWKKLAKFLRQSLYSEPTFERYKGIDLAHADTFHWVFDDNITKMSAWLVDDSSFFWINGKPGSGKSTMMKYIWTHKDEFRKKSQAESVDACFFFSHRGSYIQKSFEGLLHCILYQLCQNDTLAQTLMPSQAAVPEGEQLKWNADTLKDALFHVLQQQVGDINVFLLLDALDEFDGNPKSVALLLLRCVEEAKKGSINLKICFSCRPWNVFNDSFAGTPQLKMEDHPEADIARYVRGTMTECEAASSILDPRDLADSAGMKLQSQILNRAQGVFLWVRLVLDKLLSELAEGTPPGQLENILKTLPSEIEELYVALIERIKPEYRREGYIMLEIALRAEHSLKLSEFRDATECALQSPEQLSRYTCNHPQNLWVDIDNMSRRIKSRCGGLLEIVQANYRKSMAGPLFSVQLMHQTVQDFLLQPRIWRYFLQPEDDLVSLNGFSFLSQYYLLVLSQRHGDVVPVRSSDIWRDDSRQTVFISRGMHYAHMAELLSGKSQSRLLDAITDDSFSTFVKSTRESHPKTLYPRPCPIDSRLSFAVLADLRLYMRNFIAREKPDPHTLSQLLHYIVERQNEHEPSPRLFKGRAREKARGLLIEMTRLLVDAKADCTARKEGMTPFEAQFCLSLSWCYERQELRCRETFVNVLLFGLPGADPNADIKARRVSDGAFLVSKPLHIASGSLDRPTIEHLLVEGADVNGLDSCGRTPLDYIEMDCASPPPDNLQDQIVCAQLLIEHGAHLTLQMVHHQDGTRTRLYRKLKLLAPISTDQVSRPMDTRPVDSQSGVISIRGLRRFGHQIAERMKGEGSRTRKGGLVIESGVTIQSSSVEWTSLVEDRIGKAATGPRDPACQESAVLDCSTSRR